MEMSCFFLESEKICTSAKVIMVIVQNIINDWYVLLEENPEINYKKIGEVFAKLGSRIEYLKKCEKKSIYNFNDCIWKKIK